MSAKTDLCSFTGNAVGKTISQTADSLQNERTGEVLVQGGFTKNYVGRQMHATRKSMTDARGVDALQLPGLEDEKGQWSQGITISLNSVLASLNSSINGAPRGRYGGAPRRGRLHRETVVSGRVKAGCGPAGRDRSHDCVTASR